MNKKKKPVYNVHSTEKFRPIKSQKQFKLRRIITIGGAVFLASVIILIAVGLYSSEVKPLKETALEINDTVVTMDSYIDIFDVYTKNIQPEALSYMPDSVTQQIVRNELVRQGAKALDVTVTSEEIELALIQTEDSDNKAYKDIAESELLTNKILQLFNDGLPEEMEQIHANIMLVESEAVAKDAETRIHNGETFEDLNEELSCGIEEDGDLGWRPEELITNSVIADEVASLGAGTIGMVYDETAEKRVAYWLIEVTDIDDEKGREIRSMLLSSLEEAEDIKDRLETEDFEVLAEEFSLDTSSKEGGELGWLKPGDMENETFDSVAFELPVGTISDPVRDESIETVGGYWVIQLLAREMHELSAEVKSSLSQKEFIEWLTEIENNSTITIHLDEEMKSFAVKKVTKRRT